jgi:hypothetical protein
MRNQQAVAFGGVESFEILDCLFESNFTGLQFYAGSSGLVARSKFVSSSASTLFVEDGAFVQFNDNVQLQNGARGIWCENATVIRVRNLLSGGFGATVESLGSGVVALQSSTILNGGGWTVRCATRKGSVSGVESFDFTNNYWGTTDGDQIAEWILDEADNDAPIRIDVLPILDRSPISTSRVCLSGLKARFGPRQD